MSDQPSNNAQGNLASRVSEVSKPENLNNEKSLEKGIDNNKQLKSEQKDSHPNPQVTVSVDSNQNFQSIKSIEIGHLPSMSFSSPNQIIPSKKMEPISKSSPKSSKTLLANREIPPHYMKDDLLLPSQRISQVGANNINLNLPSLEIKERQEPSLSQRQRIEEMKPILPMVGDISPKRAETRSERSDGDLRQSGSFIKLSSIKNDLVTSSKWHEEQSKELAYLKSQNQSLIKENNELRSMIEHLQFNQPSGSPIRNSQKQPKYFQRNLEDLSKCTPLLESLEQNLNLVKQFTNDLINNRAKEMGMLRDKVTDIDLSSSYLSEIRNRIINLTREDEEFFKLDQAQNQNLLINEIGRLSTELSDMKKGQSPENLFRMKLVIQENDQLRTIIKEIINKPTQPSSAEEFNNLRLKAAMIAAELDTTLHELQFYKARVETLSEQESPVKHTNQSITLNLSHQEAQRSVESPLRQSQSQEIDVSPYRVARTIFNTDGEFSNQMSKLLKKIERTRVQTHEEKMIHENFTGKFDVVFCVDCTHSMAPYLNEVKLSCARIMDTLKSCTDSFQPDLLFGFVGYREHDPYNGGTWVTTIQDLTDSGTCMQFIANITTKATPKNDIPEAVLPGLWDCVTKVNWRKSEKERILRIIFHIGDAPPHGKQYYNGEDHFPNGDPSGLTIQNIADKIWELDISYRLFKIGDKLDLMEKDFRRNIKDFLSAGLQKAEDIEKLTSELITTQLNIMNNQPSIKYEIFWNRKTAKKKIMRTEYVGTCFITSVIFDEYLEIFIDGNIAKEPHLKGITILTQGSNIIGLKSKYRANKSTLVSTTPQEIQITEVKENTLLLDKEDVVVEISGSLDETGCLSGLFIKSLKGKKIQAGIQGSTAFSNIIPAKGVKLHGIGGSYRKSGFDSIYFYYSLSV